MVERAVEWLPDSLTPADKDYVAGLVKQLQGELGDGPSTRIYPRLSDCPNGTPSPAFLVNDVVAYDLSKCYKLRFENMGKEAGRMHALHELLNDPKRWLFSRAHEHLTGTELTAFTNAIEEIFPVGSEDLCLTNTKMFYTRFYGCCEYGRLLQRLFKENTAAKITMNSVGLAARLQNTLYVLGMERAFRDGGADPLMVQTDSITVRKSLLRQHPEYGLEAWRGSGSPLRWEEWVAFKMSTPGVAVWKVESEPTKAIFRGLAGRFAYQTVKATTVGGEWTQIDLLVKTSPSNMLGAELEHAPELDSEVAQVVLNEAFNGGPGVFEALLNDTDRLPLKITRKDRKGKLYKRQPELRSLLSGFVESSSSSSLSSSSSSSSSENLTPSEKAIREAARLSRESGEEYVVMACELHTGKRAFHAIKFAEKYKLVGQPFHELFVYPVRAFVDYDNEKDRLSEAVVEASMASQKEFWRQHGVDVEIRVFAMSRTSPIPAVPSFKRHIVFHAQQIGTGKEAVFADPADIPSALGKDMMALVDRQPYAWKHGLRMAGCPGARGASAYTPAGKSGEESKNNDLSNPVVHQKYCVCVTSENKIIHGTTPTGRHTAGSGLMFPSEQMIALLVQEAIAAMCPDHSVKIGASGFDERDSDAKTVWQRIEVKCVSGPNAGKLLDLTYFSEKVLMPVLTGGARSPWGKTSHKDNNNSFMNFKFCSDSKIAPGYFGQVQFKVKGAQRPGMWNMRTLDLTLRNLTKLAREAKKDWAAWAAAHQALLGKEKSQTFRLSSMLNSGAGSSRVHDAYEVRNALRRRIRASRIGACLRRAPKRLRSGHTKLDKAQHDRLEYWRQNIKKVDNPTDIGVALGFVVSCCDSATASKAIGIERSNAATTGAQWEKAFLTYLHELSAPDAPDKACPAVLRTWIETAYA